MTVDPSIIVLGGIALGGLTAYCMIQKHKREINQRVKPMFVKSDDVIYLPFNRRATVLDVRVKSGQAEYNLDLFGFNEWIKEYDLVRWLPTPAKPAPLPTGSARAAKEYGSAPSPIAEAAREARLTRERRQADERRRRDDDDILGNPIHPLNPISPLNTTRHYDDPAPSRSSYDDCGSSSRSSSSYSHSSHSCSSSSSSSDSSSSSSDSGSSSSD